MAIKINLLPPAERQPLWRVNRIMVLIAMMSFFFVGAIATYNMYFICKLEKDIGAAENQFGMLRPTLDKMVLANSQYQLTTEKHSLLMKLTSQRRPWTAIIAKLGGITPEKVWLTELAVAEKNGLRIRGNALTYPDLALFLKQLEQDELLSNPLIVKAERDPVLALTRFEVTVKVKEQLP